PIGVLDRHHVQLPVVGRLRVKEPTDKLRLRLANCSARILRASLVSEGARTYVSFSVIAERHRAAPRSQGVCGHDVGIAALVTGSDGAVTQNPRSAEAAQKRISRYQRRMDRQHRAASPACFNSDGTHVAGTCHWKERYRRQLAYKCPWYGAWLWLASTWFPSSLTCSSCRAKKERLSRRARVFRCDACGTEMDRDLNAAKNLAALAELACVCLMAQMATGIPVYWSKLPIRPYGWEPDRDTRSSRGCARARGLRAEGGERKTARAGRGG